MISKAHLVYFSPTKTTKRIVEQIAHGLNAGEVAHYDLTCSEQRGDVGLNDGVAVIGVPVYAGRVPEVCLERMRKLSAVGIPAVIVVLYGNRAFEDALVELRDTVVAKGVSVVAAGAFIGEHSYSTSDHPIAPNRPDTDDVRKAQEFGALLVGCLQQGVGSVTPRIPGNLPYKERVPLGGIAPVTSEARCTLCGNCARVCPTHAITVADAVATDAQRCILCCACVKECPEQARTLQHPTVDARREMLVKNFSERKEPELFL